MRAISDVFRIVTAQPSQGGKIMKLLLSLRFRAKVVYINYLVWKNDLLRWPKLYPPPEVMTEAHLDYIIHTIKRSRELFDNIDKIPRL